jgi:UDP-N-acetylmuramoyl-tripeptide--D-alanyl-D-alanine ligase
MIAARLSQVAQAVAPRLIRGDAAFAGVSTDTRTVAPGELFVALRGERHDAHEFAGHAIERGAAALMVERELDVDLPQLVVLETLEALGQLARWYRDRLHAHVIGLTGSNGKTTVKTLTAEILSRCGATHVNAGNLNNEVGLPLSLMRAPEDARHLVLEMGAGKPGDIAYLAGIALPTIALVNNVAPAHLERMRSIEGVAETKGAIYAALPSDGTAVINADDRFAGYFEGVAGSRRTLRFGLDHAADVGARNVDLGHASRFVLRTPAGEAEVELALAGRHNVLNALAASALALAAGAPLAAIRDGLAAARAVGGRLARTALPGGVTLIDDSYNANPASVRAAIDTLALEPGERWLVLGNMAELGPDAPRLHTEAGAHARAAGIQRLYAVGALARHAAEAFGTDARAFDSREAAIDSLRADLHGGTTLLVKGSRSSAMETIVRALAGQADGGTKHAA